MARSLKKGPFADVSLLKKVDAMNAVSYTHLTQWRSYSAALQAEVPLCKNLQGKTEACLSAAGRRV